MPATLIKSKRSKPAADKQHFENAALFSAISKSQAVIEFNLDGTIITANDNFLTTLGYTLDEISGRHHSMFVDEAYKQSPVQGFLGQAEPRRIRCGRVQTFRQGGKEVWIQASYNPILDTDGKPFKVVKYATDITAAKLQSADFAGQLAAISKSQAVIEFNLDGTIVTPTKTS